MGGTNNFRGNSNSKEVLAKLFAKMGEIGSFKAKHSIPRKRNFVFRVNGTKTIETSKG